MKIGYGRIRSSFSIASKKLMVTAGLFVLPISMCLEKVSSAPRPKPPFKAPNQVTPEPDQRIERVRRFLSKLHCPVSYLAADFVRAADENDLDWRLLPSISVIESGGGKAYKNNNIFGWANGDHFFSTLKSGINEVAFKLGKSPLYRNRNVAGKLHIYNPNEEYAGNVMSVMNRISPVVHLSKVKRLARPQPKLSYATD